MFLPLLINRQYRDLMLQYLSSIQEIATADHAVVFRTPSVTFTIPLFPAEVNPLCALRRLQFLASLSQNNTIVNRISVVRDDCINVALPREFLVYIYGSDSVCDVRFPSTVQSPQVSRLHTQCLPQNVETITSFTNFEASDGNMIPFELQTPPYVWSCHIQWQPVRLNMPKDTMFHSYSRTRRALDANELQADDIMLIIRDYASIIRCSRLQSFSATTLVTRLSVQFEAQLTDRDRSWLSLYLGPVLNQAMSLRTFQLRMVDTDAHLWRGAEDTETVLTEIVQAATSLPSLLDTMRYDFRNLDHLQTAHFVREIQLHRGLAPELHYERQLLTRVQLRVRDVLQRCTVSEDAGRYTFTLRNETHQSFTSILTLVVKHSS